MPSQNRSWVDTAISSNGNTRCLSPELPWESATERFGGSKVSVCLELKKRSVYTGCGHGVQKAGKAATLGQRRPSFSLDGFVTCLGRGRSPDRAEPHDAGTQPQSQYECFHPQAMLARYANQTAVGRCRCSHSILYLDRIARMGERKERYSCTAGWYRSDHTELQRREVEEDRSTAESWIKPRLSIVPYLREEYHGKRGFADRKRWGAERHWCPTNSARGRHQEHNSHSVETRKSTLLANVEVSGMLSLTSVIPWSASHL